MITKLFIPENLDMDQYIAVHPPIFKFKKEYFYYILHLLTEIPAHNKDLRGKEFIPINAARLQKVVHEYKKYLSYLIYWHIIESDDYFIEGEKSTGYRFTSPYRTLVKEVPITLFTLAKSIQKVKISSSGTTKYQHLRKFFNASFQIDDTLARRYLKETYEIDVSNGNPYAFQAYNASLLNVNRLRDQDFYFSVDDTGNRLHTNLTNLKSDLRMFLKYDNKSLVSVDITNSQPLLSTTLLKPEFYSTVTTTPFSYEYLNRILSKPLQITTPTFNTITHTPTLTLAENQESAVNTGVSDISVFNEKVTTGIIYEFIIDALKNGTPSININRPTAKTMVFTVLFSDNRFIGQPEAYPKRLFKELFPSVYDIFAQIKRKSHNSLAILLQKIESHLMLDFVAARITKECPKLPIFTIHDSIVTTTGNEQYVSRIICEEMQRCIGVQPKLKLEYWSPKVIHMFTEKKEVA